MQKHALSSRRWLRKITYFLTYQMCTLYRVYHALQNERSQVLSTFITAMWRKENSLEDIILRNDVTRNRVTSALLWLSPSLLFVLSSSFSVPSLSQPLRSPFTTSYDPPPLLGLYEEPRRGIVLRKGNGAETAQMTREFSPGGRDFLLVFMFSRHSSS